MGERLHEESIIVGEVEITAVTDIEGPFFRLNQLSPGVRTEQASFTRAQLLDWLEAEGSGSPPAAFPASAASPAGEDGATGGDAGSRAVYARVPILWRR